MARPSPARSNKLTAEEVRLQKQTEELLRKKRALEEQLQRLPAQVAAKRTKEKQLAKIRAEMTPAAISLNGLRSTRAQQTRRNHRPLPTREAQNAQIKFIVLCLILATIALLLWRSLPS